MIGRCKQCGLAKTSRGDFNGFVCRLQSVGYPRRAYFSYPKYYAIGERVHGSFDEPILKPGGGAYSHTLPIRVCAAQRGRDLEAPDLERGIHFRGVF